MAQPSGPIVLTWRPEPTSQSNHKSPYPRRIQKAKRRKEAHPDSFHSQAVIVKPDQRLLKAPGIATAHPFINDRLKELRISGLQDLDTFCQWSALKEYQPATDAERQWSQHVEVLWSKALFDWANTDPLIFYTVLQAVLDKRYNITAHDHAKDIAVINARMIPLLNDRLSRPHALNGLEAMAITGLTFMAMRLGDFAIAQVHQRAIQRIFDLTRPDPHVWLYVYWASLRLSAASFLPAFLRKEIPKDWSFPALAETQHAKAQRAALRDVRAFGQPLVADNNEFYQCFRQMHEITIVQETSPDPVSALVAPVYSICYDICNLHAKVHLAHTPIVPADQAAITELVAIALKCCAWNKASFVGPHGGKVQQEILSHADQLASTLAPFDVERLAHTHGMNPRALLWLFLVLSAEAYWYQPDSRAVWLRWLSRTVQMLGLTTQSSFRRALAGFPCTGPTYSKRMVRAWQDAGCGAEGKRSWQRELQDNRRGVHGETAGFGKYLGILNFQIDVE